MVIDSHWRHLAQSGIKNVVSQPECAGIDVFGTEILEGDEIVIDHDHFDEIILKENLKRYCMEQLHFRFDRGWVITKNELLCQEIWLEQVLHEEYNFEFKLAE